LRIYTLPAYTHEDARIQATNKDLPNAKKDQGAKDAKPEKLPPNPFWDEKDQVVKAPKKTSVKPKADKSPSRAGEPKPAGKKLDGS